MSAMTRNRMKATRRTACSAFGLLFALFCLAVPAWSQGAAAYLKMGVGARALGMGGAFTAVADDATALYWNPGGLSTLKRREATAMHADLNLDRSFDFVGFAAPMEKGQGAWGTSYTRFSITGIPETRVRPGTTLPQLTDDIYGAGDAFAASGPGLGQVRIFSLFDDVEQSFTGSYARQVGDDLHLGVTARLLKQDLFNTDAGGLGLDFGLLYRKDADWTLGFAVKDLFETLEFGGGLRDADVDETVSGGASYKGFKDTLISAEATTTGGRDLKLRAGAERWFDGKYAVRAGSNQGDFAAGASLRFDDWQFDYSFQSQELGDVQRLSFVKRF